MSDTSSQNPLATIPFEIPFPLLRADQIEAAIDHLIALADQRIAAIEATTDPLTYQSVIAALENATEELELASTVIGHLESVNSTPEWRAAYHAIQQPLSLFYSRVTLSEPLWNAVRSVAASPEIASFSPAQRRFVAKLVDDFKRQGAELPPEKKERLKAIDAELATITAAFSQNTLDATNQHEWVFATPEPLRGLPPTALDRAAQSAREKGLTGYRLTLHGPSYIAAMTYLDDATLRERLYRAYVTRASSGTTDNCPNLLRIIALRRERSQLLGFSHFADLVLDDRMAKKGETARQFLSALRDRVEAQAYQENLELRAFRRSLEGAHAPELQPWDVAYYAEKQRKALYDFDEEAVREFFPVEVVMEGLFAVVGSLFGVTITPDTLPVWHPEVRTYTMHDTSGRRDRLLLCGPLSTRIKAWRRVDERFYPWKSYRGRRTARPSSRSYLRQFYSTLRNASCASHARRSEHPFSRVWAPPPPSLQHRPRALARGNECSVGFCRASLADHGELDVAT